MASGKGKPFNENMSDGAKAYHSCFDGFLKKDTTYIVSFEITPLCEDFGLFNTKKNHKVSMLNIRAKHSR